MKKFIFALITGFLFCTHASAADKIRVSVTNYNMSYLAAGVAAKHGFFKEEGLDVEIVRMNANVAMSSLISGDVDYTMIFASVIRAAMRGIPLKVIAVLIDSPPYAFIARPEISAMKTLKGKTVGIGVYGSSNDIIARMMLERSGIDPDKEKKDSSRRRLSPRPPTLRRASSGLTCLPAPTICLSFPISGSARRIRNSKKIPRRLLE